MYVVHFPSNKEAAAPSPGGLAIDTPLPSTGFQEEPLSPVPAQGSGSRHSPPRARGSLSRDAVVAAGLRMARRGDLARLTMKGLADELGVTPMAIYRHFRNKRQVVDGVLDRFVNAAANTEEARRCAASDWRRWLELTFRALHDRLAETPGVMTLLCTAEDLESGVLARLDEALGVLRGAGFDDATAVEAIHVLTAFTIGSAGLTAAWREGGRGQDPDERRRQLRLRFESAPRASHPNVVAAAGALAALSQTDPFGIGLSALLDDFERRTPG